MFKSLFRSSSPGLKLLLLGSIIIFCFFLSMPFIILGGKLLGYSAGVFMNLTTDHIDQHLNLFRMVQLVQSVFVFLLPPLFFAYLTGDNPFAYLNLKKNIKGIWIIGILALLIISVPFLNLLSELNGKIEIPQNLSSLRNWIESSEKEASLITEHFLGVKSISALLFNLFMIALIPALGEEFLFRGVIQRLFTDMFRNYHLGIWISAMVFGAFHLQFLTVFPRILLGAMFGYLLVWSQSLWLPILAHFLNNALAVIFYWLWFNGYAGKQIDEIGTTASSIYPAILSAVLILAWMFWFYKITREKDQIRLS